MDASGGVTFGQMLKSDGSYDIAKYKEAWGKFKQVMRLVEPVGKKQRRMLTDINYNRAFRLGFEPVVLCSDIKAPKHFKGSVILVPPSLLREVWSKTQKEAKGKKPDKKPPHLPVKVLAAANL